MCTLLTIETSTPVCSCALSRDGEILVNKENYEGRSHASLVGLFVHEIMEYARERDIHLDAIAVSSGPGSYTGLRIGVSEAKGLSYGLDIPMIAIPTACIMASMMRGKADEDTLLCPMIDARRMEVYATFFDRSLNMIRETSADIVKEESYSDLLEKQKVLFFGNGAEKCRTLITHPNALFFDDIHPLASAMVPLAEKAFTDKTFVDVAYFEPFYLKEFVATTPKNKVIDVKS
ncbi:tRNA (adenosine(37)-N6)-threonylcarbamoyltransferase complex dimerization subunit type 1 TsaB [Proteiniphilum sp. X52]|uniref:tRNA (adenosine(37)-N6)-threonylcarbamoyltransferase complex dimerization subunit type 1 TsaB n=1 Tax=Proteiniphilum sp. X52 TaxID=2382159 RepID=UPI000F0A28BA|nr:tRNA (adenosine(37)-N6)-threonylcarbamoyltransferase complex dimerization subunit type 1 TsaB [Proteiniphilum sp. X52]RNC67156.1 tRNA (adenosine(37)-N6)-threonylcarbamoyltransferase complex dimerization subunit type 1 TsaB [Proteiniphilum sp. X52]